MLEVEPFKYISVHGGITEWMVLWCDSELGRTCFGCREKMGDQLRWSLAHVALEDQKLEYEYIPVTAKPEDTVLRTLILRALKLKEEDLYPNEILCIIHIPYISRLNERCYNMESKTQEHNDLWVILRYHERQLRRSKRLRNTSKKRYVIKCEGFYV